MIQKLISGKVKIMLRQDLINYLNNSILKKTKDLKYSVSDHAPNSEIDLFNSTSLVVWSGQSDNTIYHDSRVNWAFRALHDDLHLRSGLSFSHAHEIELGRLQALQFDSSIVKDLIYCEVALQAMYHRDTGLFIPNQVEFTKQFLKSKGYTV